MPAETFRTSRPRATRNGEPAHLRAPERLRQSSIVAPMYHAPMHKPSLVERLFGRV